MALALRGRAAPLRLLAPVAVAGAALSVLALYLLVPPRGELADPEYYANGPDIPAALRAIDDAQDSAATISEELDAQLVGLARLIAEPGERGPATRLAASRSPPTSTTTCWRCPRSSGRWTAGRWCSPATSPTAARRSRRRSPPAWRERATRWCSWPATTTRTRWSAACDGPGW